MDINKYLEAKHQRDHAAEDSFVPSPEEESANPFTKYIFTWISPLLTRGWERSKNGDVFHDKDLLRLPEDEDIHRAYAIFRAAWEAELAYTKTRQDAAATEAEALSIKPRLYLVLLKCFKKDLLISAAGRFISDGAMIAASFYIREVIKWIGLLVTNPNDVREYDGFIWSVAVALNQELISVANNISLFHVQKAFCNMRSVLVLSVYDKSLQLEASHGITGLVQQIHGADTYKFIEMCLFMQQLWSAPLMIIAALISLYFFIGWAGVIAFGVILIGVPFQGVIAKKMMAARMACIELADQRVNAINEILHGIRIIKFMGWEERFLDRVDEIRSREMRQIHRLLWIRSILVGVVTFLPIVLALFVFAVAYKGFDFEITPTSVFPAISMLNILRMPMAQFPIGVGKLVDAFVSLDRLREFFLRPDRVVRLTKTDNIETSDAVVLKNVTVQYTTDVAVNVGGVDTVQQRTSDLMKNINLTIQRGKLTLVVGATGGGKSTLMNTMIGEMLVTEDSSVTVNGQVAYITQEAWIMNATLRDNILCGKEFVHETYLATINDCQLVSDLRELAASDMTEIGERGVNVSGGQKQRIAFARAVYSGREIVLMDDPLSAVDSHVCVALFEDCIMGALAGRTRVLVTHQVQFLPYADRIVVVDNCEVAFDGTYEELQNSTVDVARMINEQSPVTNRNIQNDNEQFDATPGSDAAVAASPMSGEDSNVKKQPKKEKRSRATELPAPNQEELKSLMTTERQSQGVNLAVYGWYFKIQHPFVVLMIIMSFSVWRGVNIIADLMVSWWSSHTKVIGHTPTDDQYLQWYGIFIALTGITIALRQVPFVQAKLNAAKASNSRMVRSLLHAPTAFFDTTPTGRVISRFSKDMEQMDLSIPEAMNSFYNLIFQILGAYGLMIYAATYLVAVIVVLLLLLMAVYRYYSTTNRAQKSLEATNRSPMTSVLNETLGGLPTIRAYDMVDNFTAKHALKLKHSVRAVYSWRVSQRWFSVRMDVISSTVVLATTLIICGVLVSSSDRAATAPVVSLAITYSVAIATAFGFLTTISSEIESGMTSVERVKEYCDDLPQEKVVTYGTGPDETPAPPPNWPSAGCVEFSNASLRYRDGLPLVLKSLSVRIDAGFKVGIVGRTGSGKSTIMLALFRMVELAEGTIQFDGVDISSLNMKDLRNKITIIPQDPMLFQGTVRSNLDPFFQATDEDVWRVIGTVGITERVKRDGEGLNCVVAEKGANFSVGQRQLLCLARALLKNCKILLLDEATASVDFEADALIQRTLRTAFKECTVLTIAHRLATVIDSDRIMLMEHGVLREYDSPANLVRSDASMFNAMLKRLGPEQYGLLYNEAIVSEKKTLS